MDIKGMYNEAKIFTDKVEDTALRQVEDMCNTDFLEGNKIRMMPDIHAGKGCTIGTTMTIGDIVVPGHVGVDVGCGLITVSLDEYDLDFNKLDKVIKEHVPNGSNNYLEARYISKKGKKEYNIKDVLSQERMDKALGTLGGGNHFIEVSRDGTGRHYLVIHTGSRYLGAKVATEYQKRANALYTKNDTKELINKMKKEGRHQEIESELRKLKDKNKVYEGVVMYLEGQDMEDYLHDLGLAQEFARENRLNIVNTIVDNMGWNVETYFDTIHNYIDLDRMILRKGAVRAEKEEKLIIPINMRDGSLICVGKGNEEWNYSAPHGAGRVLSRRKARENLNVREFKEQMSGVWTSSVGEDTIDEAPGAYKNIEDIVDNIGDTVDIKQHLKPVYNFKAKEGKPFWMK